MGGGRFRERQHVSWPNGTVVGELTQVDTWSNNSTGPPRIMICDPWYEWPHSTDKCWDQTNRRPYIGGGPLRIESSGCNSTVQGIGASGLAWGYIWTYTGNVTCRVMIPAYNQRNVEGIYTPVPQPSSVPSAAYLGPDAWNKYRPGKPLMSLGVSLGELRDFPRMVTQLRNGVRFLKNLGSKAPKRVVDQAASQYLGYQFGWKQMVSDIRGLINFQARCDEYYRSLLKNNGTWATRGGTIDRLEEQSYAITGDDYIAVCPLGVPQNGASEMTYSRGFTQRAWFKGRFKYYIQEVKTPEGMLEFRRKALGMTLTPDLVWNLVPWTWLLDWHSSFGSSIANLTNGNVDDLVAEYAFVMRQTYHYERTVATVPFSQWNGQYNTTHHVSLVGENFSSVKTRDAASPFGFGLSLGDYTGRQIAILAALGLSR